MSQNTITVKKHYMEQTISYIFKSCRAAEDTVCSTQTQRL